jgi:poly(3-hydroxybutyrate) depolymerase
MFTRAIATAAAASKKGARSVHTVVFMRHGCAQQARGGERAGDASECAERDTDRGEAS